jgi:hypothetical protein
MRKLLWPVALLVFFVAGCASTNDDAKLDYQRLKGKWEWGYPIGYDTLTIETVTVPDKKAYVFGFYDVSNTNATVRSRHVEGEIDLNREPNEIVFKGFGRLELRWNGGGRLWGSCMFKTWSGDCEFTKR